MESKVRVRFAPSPTGGLHLGGVRTVLYNYLYARKHNGTFVLRIEDTDQTRYVEGAEEYIMECLRWCGLIPDESVETGGPFAPYRQSERKEIYRKYAEQLVSDGYAYYAFDTPEELNEMRERLKGEGKPSLQYDHNVRMHMKNSLHLSAEETIQLIDSGIPYVIRLKVPPGESVIIHDLIRGDLEMQTDVIDDKVLLKADGMPTYHLAVVVDDHLMQITHAFRGEEWLPSAPAHVLLWKYLFGLENMPAWAHLPLILKPDGHGKLSKRDGDRLGFPVYAMDWTDAEGHTTKGFRELGFLPEAFLNMLVLLGWNDGSGQEIFTLDEMCEKFSIERVHKGGAKFDFEKARWFNHEWIKRSPVSRIEEEVRKIFESKGIAIIDNEKWLRILELIKERCTLLSDFYDQGSFFFVAPVTHDIEAVTAKWNQDKTSFFYEFIIRLRDLNEFDASSIESLFKTLAAERGIKPGELQLPFRIMLVGAKFGPAVFDIASLLGKEETISRIESLIRKLHTA